MTEENEAVVEEAIYASRNAPTLKFNGVRFAGGTFKTADPERIALWDDLIATKPAVGALIYKVDRAAALAIAEEHKAAQLNQAHSGSMNSTAMRANETEARNKELAAVQNNPATAELIPETDLMLTEAGTVEHGASDAGFTADKPEPDAVAEDAPVETAKPASALKLLGNKAE